MANKFFKLVYLLLVLSLIAMMILLFNSQPNKPEGEVVSRYLKISDFKNPNVILTDKSEVLVENGEIRDWRLILINQQNSIPDNYNIMLTTLANGQKVDARILPELQLMFDDMRKEGLSPKVTWGYRSFEDQFNLFNEAYKERIEKGMSDEDAIIDTTKSVAEPGKSEHEIGLAVDINSTKSQEDTLSIYNWLKNNSYKYGFILRYPDNKIDITGLLYEPWHYRYVGVNHATEIYNLDLTLEEYISRIK